MSAPYIVGKWFQARPNDRGYTHGQVIRQMSAPGQLDHSHFLVKMHGGVAGEYRLVAFTRMGRIGQLGQYYESEAELRRFVAADQLVR